MNQYADPIANLRSLVAFKTVSNSSTLEICEWVTEACSSFGFTCELEKDPVNPSKANVIAVIGPRVPGGLIISGHLDVVPTEGQPWVTDPFALTIKEDRLYGRGTSDMKGFIAATLSSFTQIDLKNLQKPLVLVWTYDEEIGCKGSAQFALNHKELPAWYPREALIGEPTDLQIFRMHPGHVSFKISITGKAAHSSKPDMGISAIVAANHILSLLVELEEDLKRERRLEKHLERPYVTLNIGMIHGGQAVNIVPDHCEILVGYRPLPGDDPKAVFHRFEERLRNRLHMREAQVELSLQSLTPALFTESGSPLENILHSHSCAKEASAAAFATDGGNLASIGIESLIFGPGTIDVAHRENEFIERKALEAAPSMIADIVRRRCE